MDKINKALLNLSNKQRKKLLESFQLIVHGKTEGLNIKKLKGRTDLYRLRVGDARLVYKVVSKQSVIVYVGKRDDQTYRNF